MRLLLCLIPGSLLILEVCLVLALLFCAIVLLAFRHNAMRAARLMTSSTPSGVDRRTAFASWPVRRAAFLSTGAIE